MLFLLYTKEGELVSWWAGILVMGWEFGGGGGGELGQFTCFSDDPWSIKNNTFWGKAYLNK